MDDREAIIRAAVAAMPSTNPLVAEDLLAGHTMHTEADDIVAIWRAAQAAPELTDIEARARNAYAIWTDNQGIHCNRFPSWDECDPATRNHWRQQVRAAAEIGRTM